MDERVGVDAFNCASQGKGISDLATASLRRSEAKNRAKPFPSREQAVTHRLVNRRRLHAFFGQKAIERLLDLLLPGGDVILKIHTIDM